MHLPLDELRIRRILTTKGGAFCATIYLVDDDPDSWLLSENIWSIWNFGW
jgi:hypothetical protein